MYKLRNLMYNKYYILIIICAFLLYTVTYVMVILSLIYYYKYNVISMLTFLNEIQM